MANVQGVYRIYAELKDGNNADLYTFTNADRAAEVNFTQDTELNFNQIDGVVTPGGIVRKFVKACKLNVLRGRILTPGAPGLQPAKGRIAANLVLQATNDDNEPGNSLKLIFSVYNEWVNFGIPFESFNITTDSYYFKLRYAAPSFLTVDDYNLQSAYEGETLNAALELEVASSGLYSADGSIV